MAVNKSGMLKVAGLSLLGFCAVSIGVDRANIGPLTSQIAGFSGALLGGLAAHRRARAAAKSAGSAPAWAPALRRDGYVQFPQLVPAELVEAARAEIVRSVAEHYDESKLTEYNNRSWCPELRRAPQILALLNNPEVRSVLDAALGKRKYRSSPGQIAIRKAHSASHSTEPVPHIDGIPTPDNGLEGETLHPFTALVGVFLTEVTQEFAGNFTVWPGSHTLLEQHFQQRGKAALTEGMPAIPLGTPVQLLCKPGDVVFCHYELAHAAAVNTSNDDRIAVFFRVTLKDLAASGQRWRSLTNLWHGWRI
jgi:hypothetical protein